MDNENQDNFDLLLREHLAQELDGQLGRAPAAFARSSRRRPWRVVGMLTGLAAAACAAVFFLRPATPQSDDQPQVATAEASAVEYQIAWQTTDQGTVFVDDEPMRQVHRQRIDRLRWVDPSTKQTVEVSIPHDEIVLVGLQSS